MWRRLSFVEIVLYTTWQLVRHEEYIYYMLISRQTIGYLHSDEFHQVIIRVGCGRKTYRTSCFSKSRGMGPWNLFNTATFHWSDCTKPGVWAVMCIIMGIDYSASVYPSCNNVAPVTNLCLGRTTTRSHSSQWSKKRVAVET